MSGTKVPKMTVDLICCDTIKVVFVKTCCSVAARLAPNLLPSKNPSTTLFLDPYVSILADFLKELQLFHLPCYSL